MQKIFILFLFIVPTLLPFRTSAQKIPTINIQALDGTSFNTGILNTEDNRIKVISFWATWCIPCVNELSSINDLTSTWKKELNYDFYAISVDDSRTSKKVSSLVNGKNWDFFVLLDKNQELKRLLNLPSIPYTLAVKNGKIIYNHVGYNEGDENELYNIIKNNQ